MDRRRYVLRKRRYIQHNHKNDKLCLQIELDSNLIKFHIIICLFVWGFSPAREFSLIWSIIKGISEDP